MNIARIYGGQLLLLLFLLAGTATFCAGQPATPMPAREVPSFRDDFSTDSLKKAIRINLVYLEKQPEGKSVRIAGQKVSRDRMVRSLQLFLEILERNPSPAELDRLIREHFEIFQAAGNHLLVTGYYQPVFSGSLTREAPFLHPLYGVPADLVKGSGGNSDPAFGRLENGRLVPYWSRKEIEEQRRAAGHELVWLQDPFDAFLVHIQGSAIIQLRDGSRRGIHIAARNGHPYRSIGGYLIRTGRLSRQATTMQTIRDYLAAHPTGRDEILHANPSFIFFAWTDTTAVTGSLGTELTAGRSLAADQDIFPACTLGFLVSRRPQLADDESVRWSPLRRFVVVQDAGSAIKGSGRLDLFWGTGPEAGAEAGLMKESGELYFLLAREQGTPSPAEQAAASPRQKP